MKHGQNYQLVYCLSKFYIGFGNLDICTIVLLLKDNKFKSSVLIRT